MERAKLERDGRAEVDETCCAGLWEGNDLPSLQVLPPQRVAAEGEIARPVLAR